MSLWKVVAVVALLNVGVVNRVLAESPPGPACPSMQGCTLSCPYGFLKDSNNCPNCTCNEPCKGYDCGQYEMCEVRVLPCAGQSPCPPEPVCVPKTGIASSPLPISTTRGKDLCLYDPDTARCEGTWDRWFFNVSALQCQKFVYGGCNGNGNNFITLADCLARCLPTSVNCPEVSCANPCQIQYDSKGCNVCVCPGATCKDVSCQGSQVCAIVPGQCPSSAQMCHPMPECQPGDTGISVTPAHCPYIDCELLLCDYGFKNDQFGCKTCSCIDPCETFTCPTGQRCAIMASDCPPGSQCRDPPMRYCTDETPAPVTRAKPTDVDLISCCAFEQVSSSCMPLCTPDLTVSSQNVATLLGCAGELNKYLKCAGGGESYTQCCAKKGLGSSCYEFCAGNATIDTTNPHLFTECIISNDLNDVISCFLQGQPDPKSSTAPVVTPSAGMVSGPSTPVFEQQACMLIPDAGTCNNMQQRWYYNPNTMMCETFDYGGCGGNMNNFLTKIDCILMCKADSPVCPEIMCMPGCSFVTGPDGCNQCACPTPLMSVSMGGDVSGSSGFTTNIPTAKLTSSPAIKSVMDCCLDHGVTNKCLPFCSFDFNFDATQVPLLLDCQQFINVGLQCAMGGKSYTKCCQHSGVGGQCLDACGGHANITDIMCLVTDHSFMLNCFAHEQIDVDCSPVNCLNNCTYGTLKDSNGCKTCNCVEPCKDKQCPTGKVCTAEQYADCSGDTCLLAYRGVCSNATNQCPTVSTCPNSCPYGRVKDSNQCEICDCYDPCKGVACGNGSVCSVEACDKDVANCQIPYVGLCKVDCGVLDCRPNNCEYGYVKDANGCYTCTCYDPCQNVSCGLNQKCVPKIIPTSVGGEMREIVVGECQGCPMMMCARGCEYDTVNKDNNGCPTCTCNSYCQNVTCEVGKVCKVEQTFGPADEPIMKGVCLGENECAGVSCMMYCPNGRIKDSNGCETCACLEPCRNITCDEGYECQIQSIVPTSSYPYNITGKCLPRTSECNLPMCTMNCENGFQKDNNSCPVCKCYEPCADMQCSPGFVCKIQPTTEGDNSKYNVKGVCTFDHCAPPPCNQYCKYGMVIDANGCQSRTCECVDPCKNVTCDSSSVCQPMQVYNSTNQFKGECVRCTGMLCDIRCDYGVVMLTRTCPLCECFEPCKNLSCTASQTCEIKSVGITADSLQSYAGQCVSKGCPGPTVMCSNQCEFGYMKTSAGCDTCDCIDPCKDYNCQIGLVCEARQDPSCTTTPCSRPPLTVCVTPSKPCARQQQRDYERYTGQDSNSAQLNCDVNGNYKPLQCVSDLDCRCSAQNGFSNYNGLTRDQAINICYPEDRILGVMRLYADISIIQPGRGSFFKQNVSKQIADLFGMSDSNVTITQYVSGSIVIDFVASVVDRFTMDSAQNTLQRLEVTNQMIPIEYDGQHYHAVIESYERKGPYNTYTSTSAPAHKGLTRTQILILAIVIPVGSVLLLGLIVGICLFMFYKRGTHTELISESARSSMSFDSVMEVKGPKAGYENPNYDTTKIRPASGTFPSGVTTA